MTSLTAPRSGGTTVVVDDFVSVDRSFGDAVAAVARVTSKSIERLLIEAWLAELDAVGLEDPGSVLRSEPQVVVELGPTRHRSDTTFLPLRWSSCGGSWMAPLDADLEVIRFGPGRTHLRLLGISRCPPDAGAAPPVVQRANRLTEAFVRHFLTTLAGRLDAGTAPRGQGGDHADR